jgi:hypothetical protein
MGLSLICVWVLAHLVRPDLAGNENTMPESSRSLYASVKDAIEHGVLG